MTDNRDWTQTQTEQAGSRFYCNIYELTSRQTERQVWQAGSGASGLGTEEQGWYRRPQSVRHKDCRYLSWTMKIEVLRRPGQRWNRSGGWWRGLEISGWSAEPDIGGWSAELGDVDSWQAGEPVEPGKQVRTGVQLGVAVRWWEKEGKSEGIWWTGWGLQVWEFKRVWLKNKLWQ